MGGRESFLPLTGESRGNLRRGNEQKVRVSYTTFATKSSTTWNYTVGKQAGHLRHWFHSVLYKEVVCSEIMLNFHLEASLNTKCFSQRWKTQYWCDEGMEQPKHLDTHSGPSRPACPHVQHLGCVCASCQQGGEALAHGTQRG